jgi:hypothetical protein
MYFYSHSVDRNKRFCIHLFTLIITLEASIAEILREMLNAVNLSENVAQAFSL